jgi:Zn-finger nucleic acid-binding protein
VSGPFRDQETLYLCPRCGDVMVAAFEGVHGCVRCQGTWIPQPVVERAFGSPTWPTGANAWWHRALQCPECASQMNAVSVDSTLVDRCPAHGVWLDQGELRRTLDARDASDLAALHRLLKLDTPFADIDYASDALRRRQLELTRQRRAQLAVEAEQARVEAEQAREQVERAEAQRRARAEQQRAERATIDRERADVVRQRLEAERKAEEERATAERREAERRDAERRRTWITEQAQLWSERESLEAEITRHRDALAHLERKLSFVRSRLLMIQKQLELP